MWIHMQKPIYIAYIEQDEDGMYVGSVPNVSGCHAEGKTQKEMLKNLQEVLALCLRNSKKSSKSRFVGIQSVETPYA